MRLAHFRSDRTETPWAGIVREDNSVVRVPEAGAGAGIPVPAAVDDIIGQWAWERKLAIIGDYADDTGTGIYPRAELERLAPIRSPEKIICVGLNYQEHAEEGGRDAPENPVLFSKFPATIVGPEEPIEWDPSVTEQVDYEAELVVVIGEKTRDVDPEDAWDAVAGYTVGNDVSARDIQHGDGQWVRGKSLDTFAPLGPDLVTADEVDDPHDLPLWAEVNGERLQESSTENLIFGIDHLISFISQTSTLYPGDVLFTGTPPGVGIYREPPVLLEEGDTVSIGVEGLGVLSNECIYR